MNKCDEARNSSVADLVRQEADYYEMICETGTFY